MENQTVDQKTQDLIDNVTEEVVEVVESAPSQVQASAEAPKEVIVTPSTSEVASEPVVNSVNQQAINNQSTIEEKPQEENLNKIKQELVYGQITLSDRDIFIDPIKINARHKKEYRGEICTVVVYDIEDKDLKKLRNEIASNKAKYHTARGAKNTGTIVSGVAKGVFGGIKGFGKGVKTSFKSELKKLY